MTTWVALLRGVNVNGITVRSADLAKLFRDCGFEAVKTVLASGNVRFESPEPEAGRAQLKSRIETALRERFGYEAWIVLVTMEQLRTAIEQSPFELLDDARHPYMIFCVDDATRAELLEAVATLDAGTDPTSPAPGGVYWNPAKGSSTDTPFAKILGRATYRSRTTTRTVRTLVKLVP